jgi:hypothetical protein
MSTEALIMADFKTTPYDHQAKEFEISADLEARALLWQMRTGKTKLIIDTACHLFLQDKIEVCVVVAPNGVHDNWARRELPIHHWDTVERDTLTWITDIAGDKGIARVKAHERKGWQEQHDAWWMRLERVLKTSKMKWIFLASETMTREEVRKIIARIARRHKGKILTVFDESHDFRTPGSKRTKMALALGRKSKYTRILTGTALDNSPLHAFTQYQLLEAGCLGFEKYSDFKRHHAVYEVKQSRQGRSFPVLVEYRDLEGMRDKMAVLSSVVLREDCEDLPALIPMIREIQTTAEQQRIYDEFRKSFEVLILGEEVSIGENTMRMIKLQQILSGFVKDEYGDIHDIPGINPKLEAVIDEAELSAGKVIIWCNFHEDMDRVCVALRARKHVVVEYHGRVNAAGKLAARQAFEPGAENDVKALVGYPTAGLDLSSAEKIIWYSHTFDAIKRGQADERATAMGGKNIPVIDFIAGGVDTYITDNVKQKVSVADAMTREGMKTVLEKVKL